MKTQDNDEVIKKLEIEVRNLKAQLAGTYHFASSGLQKLTTDRMRGSGIIVQISYLNGNSDVPPFYVVDGLETETIEALRKEIHKSFYYATELKPQI